MTAPSPTPFGLRRLGTGRPGRRSVGRLVTRLLVTSASRFLSQPPAIVTVAAVYLTVTVVLSSIWRAAAGSAGGSVVGYPAAALVWYVVFTEMATVCHETRLIETVGQDIASGRLDVDLLRPRSVILVRLTTEAGTVMARLAVCAAAGAVLGLVLAGAPPDAVALALAVPSTVLAVVLNVTVQHLVAGSAFWVGESRTAWFLYQKLVFVVGGMLLPLEVMPDWMERVARLLPFMAMVYAPARLASGHREPGLLLVQGAWLVAAAMAVAVVFARGERRLIGARA